MEQNSLNNYQYTARFYDMDDRQMLKDDIAFYMKHAERIDGEILEIACGTGRVTIPLARAGFKVTGFDLSLGMIREFEAKLLKEAEEVQERVTLFQADMTEFKLDQKFTMIIIPFRAFQLLTEVEQITKCLINIKNHLTNEGIFILNVYKPYAYLDENWVKPETEDWTIADTSTGATVRRTNIKRQIDVIKQVNYPELIYYVTDAEGNEETFIEKLAMKYYYEDQLRELLLENEFKIIEAFGYYDERPIQQGPELIFICKK